MSTLRAIVCDGCGKVGEENRWVLHKKGWRKLYFHNDTRKRQASGSDLCEECTATVAELLDDFGIKQAKTFKTQGED